MSKLQAPVGLRKKLQEHHIGMIALSATIGRGLTIDSGKILSLAGPGGGILAYLFMGALAWCVVATLGEIVSLLPVSGPFSEIPSRFIDDAAGFTAGWFYTFTYVITFPSQISAAAAIMGYRYNAPEETFTLGKATTINPALWTSFFFICATALNLLPVEWYGRVEYAFGAFKIVCLSLIMLLQVCLNQYKGDSLPGIDVPRPIQDYFWTKCQPGDPSCKTAGAWGFMPNTFTADNNKTYTGTTAQFMGFWTALTLAFFAYIGVDMIAVTAAETAKPHKHIKTATRKIMIRTTVIYSLAFLLVGFNVPYDHAKLLTIYTQNVPVKNLLPDSLGARSPFLIATVEAGYKKLPIALNLFYAFAAWSAGTTSLYASSRTLFSLAEKGRLSAFPWLNRKLATCGSGGVPRNAVYSTAVFGFLAYTYTSADNKSHAILARFSSAATICCLIVYAIICFAGLRYFRGLKYAVPRIYRSEEDFNARSQSSLDEYAEGGEVAHAATVTTTSAETYTYPWRTKFQPVLAALGLITCILLVLFNGWYEFSLRSPSQRAGYFLACYGPVFAALLMYGGKKAMTYVKEGSESVGLVAYGNMNFEGRVEREGGRGERGFVELVWGKYIK